MLSLETDEDGNEVEVAVITCTDGGEVIAIYDDQLHDVFASLGTLRRPRASDINEDEETGKFVADLSRVGGPKLTGFTLKREAERAEVAWLLANVVGYTPQTTSGQNLR